MTSKLVKPHNSAHAFADHQRGGYLRPFWQERFSRFDDVLTCQICVGGYVTFHLEPPDSFDGDC